MTTLQEIEKRYDEMASSIGMAGTHGAFMSKQFYRTEIQALLEGLVKEIEGMRLKDSRQGFTYAFFLNSAISEVQQKVQEIIK
jgi:hypothetical protein